MTKFKCLVSGTVVAFEHAHDVEEMRKHPQYEEVLDKPTEKPVEKKSVVKETSVKE